MNDSFDILARLLAADDHPHLRDEPEYRDAQRRLEQAPELRAAYDEAKAFFDRHPALVSCDRMPPDTRERIADALRRERKASSDALPIRELGPWEVRRQFAWAAALVLLLAGMAVVSSTIIEQQDRRERRIVLRQLPPQDAFRNYVGQLMEGRLSLEERSENPVQLVSWLQEQGARAVAPPAHLMSEKSVGCAYLDGPNGKIALVCFDHQGKVVHLFVTPAESLELAGPSGPHRLRLHDRQAVQWNDADNVYLLITHDPEDELPEVFL